MTKPTSLLQFKLLKYKNPMKIGCEVSDSLLIWNNLLEWESLIGRLHFGFCKLRVRLKLLLEVIFVFKSVLRTKKSIWVEHQKMFYYIIKALELLSGKGRCFFKKHSKCFELKCSTWKHSQKNPTFIRWLRFKV